jgi:putative transcriptional regulator
MLNPNTRMEVKYNRIREVLRQRKISNKWLAEKLEKDQITVSRWCRNVQQPSLPTLFQIAELLAVQPKDLLGKG